MFKNKLFVCVLLIMILSLSGSSQFLPKKEIVSNQQIVNDSSDEEDSANKIPETTTSDSIADIQPDEVNASDDAMDQPLIVEEPVNEDTSSETSLNEIENQLREQVKKMTIEEKVAQLFVVDFHQYMYGTEDEGKVFTASDDLLFNQMKTYPVGGFIFFKENCINAEQVHTFVSDLQKNTETPLFISVDEEGGIVSRVGSNPDMKVTHLPIAATLGKDDASVTEKLAQQLGKELSELGFNMDFAPVADVNTNPNNPIIGTRAFSNDPEIAANHVAAMVEGLQSVDVMAVAKHFPGHGDTLTDSHEGSVSVSHSLERLETVEWLPFKAAIDKNVAGIMIGHIAVPNVTGNDEPATLNHKMITELLRGELGYDGLVITDALNMKAISDNYTPGDACVKALQAGVDILLMPTDISASMAGILDAIHSGDLTEERIDESVFRILRAKQSIQQ